jgi:hypothetical protein
MKGFIYLLAIIIIISCIGEKLELCPDYGKYKVEFREAEFLQSNERGTMVMLSDSAGKKIFIDAYKYYLDVKDSLFRNDKVLKLFPGNYKFYSILSPQEQNLLLEIPLRNGTRYLRSEAEAVIVKSYSNLVELKHRLANSMVVFVCKGDNLDKESIVSLEFSPPSEEFGCVNLVTGSCSYEIQVSGYLIPAFFDDSLEEWYSYCNPMTSGNDILIRITLQNTDNHTNRVLTTRTRLASGFIQGKVHTILLEVTPMEISVVSSGIIDWEDHLHDKVIQL